MKNMKNNDNVKENAEESNEKQSEQYKNIEQSGEVIIQNGDIVLHCLTIIGQIEGHYLLPSNQKTTNYEHIIPLLVAVEESERIDGLLIILNTVGGDVEAGLAISEMIASMSKPTVSLVLGGGHSIGVPLAVSTKKSFIVPTATMTIHPVRMNGTFVGIMQTFSNFIKIQDRITDFIAGNSNITKEKLTKLMLKTDEIAVPAYWCYP